MYSVVGENAVPYSVNGDLLSSVYDVYGKGTFGNLIFSENFNSLDLNTWSFTSGAYRDWQYLPENYSQNAFVSDGKLVIRNLKNNPTDNYEWSGAYMDTKGKFSFQKGSVFVRMKFSNADYFHATFWMLGTLFNGEIDIAECDGDGKTVAPAVHYFDENGNLHSRYFGYYPVDPTEYNVYQLDWTDKTISFKCNGQTQGEPFKISDATIGSHNSLQQPFYLIINTNPRSLSGLYCTGNNVTNEVDYINVYGFDS